MKYINRKLTIEKISLQKIANKFGTPFYSYSYSKLKENINNFKKSFRSFSPLICFAVKSNTNVNIIREIKKFGLGADVVSIGELMMALKAGINASKIVFSGVGKTTSEISFAIDKKILLINAESLSEIKEINRIAKSKNKRIKIGVRLNPNTDAKTLSQISTGKKENKFGVNKNTFYEIINYCKNSKNIDLKCLSVHIGSQILDHRPYEKMLRAVSQILKKTNHKFEIIFVGPDENYKLKNSLKNFANEHNLAKSLHFVGSRTDLNNFYSLADLVISASTDPEAFGRISVEAQAMGKFVIASNHGGSVETVKDGETGYLFENNNSEDLCEKIIDAISYEKHKSDKTSEACISHVREKYSKIKMCEETINFYEEVIN